jgi:uncharacterized surface protein with fasciclin (FAS1) repeats
MRLMKAVSISTLSAAALIAATPALAQTAAAQTGTPTPAPIPVQPTPAPSNAATPAAGDAAASTTVAQALTAQSDHSTLVKLVNAAGLASVLSGPDPVTVFAPDDAAFARIGGAVQQLLDPANVGSAKQIVKYHIVPGRYAAKDLIAQLKAKGGTMTLDTMDNQPLTLTLQGAGAIELTDAKGGKAYISKLSDEESNGVIEYINGVLSPTMMATTTTAPATPGTAAPANAATPATDTGASGDQGDAGTPGA